MAFSPEVLTEAHCALQMLVMPSSSQLAALFESTAIHKTPRSTRLRLTAYLAFLNTSKLPSALFIKNVKCTNPQPYWSDEREAVYWGECAGVRVWLRCMKEDWTIPEVWQAEIKRASSRVTVIHYASLLIQ